MVKTRRTVLRIPLATSMAVIATGSAVAMAAPPYRVYGSDTLAGVTRDAITQCESPGGLCTSGSLIYDDYGADLAEKELLKALPTQRIAPMSRNFQETTLTSHSNWTPWLQNIIGLDATVIVVKYAGSGYSRCPNISAPLDPNASGKVVVDSLIGLVLGGKGGVGDTAACSHPDRLAAVDALAGCFGGISFIEHFYRTDDRSVTSGTMKEKFRIQRFCNGRASGKTSGLDSNLANDDADPIRRTCVSESDTSRRTSCTLWPSTVTCTAGDPGCTQGLVVALSQADQGLADVTHSIARRVRLDSNGQTVGFANREASRQTGNAALNLNSISPNNTNVRNSAYIASSRLFVNISDIPIGSLRPGGPTAEEIANDQAQMNLYNWMTDPVLGGRFNVDPILTAHGFLPCTDDFSDPIGPGNLCSSQLPPPTAESTPTNCMPAGVVGNGSNICCSTGTVSPYAPGVCPGYACSLPNYACTPGSCCAGLICTDQGTGNFACNSEGMGLEDGFNRPGFDYNNHILEVPNPAICQDICFADQNCMAFTFVNPGIQGPKAVCWLKHAVPERVPDVNCVSGIR